MINFYIFLILALCVIGLIEVLKVVYDVGKILFKKYKLKKHNKYLQKSQKELVNEILLMFKETNKDNKFDVDIFNDATNFNISVFLPIEIYADLDTIEDKKLKLLDEKGIDLNNNAHKDYHIIGNNLFLIKYHSLFCNDEKYIENIQNIFIRMNLD